jgi:translation initiation factor IF-2-like protein
MGKIRVEELAAQMGVGSKEVLFLLQSIGVDVQSPQATLDDSMVQAILQGKTHAPKQLIVRDPEARTFRPQKSALSRIKIVDRVPAPRETAPPEAVESRERAAEPRERAGEPRERAAEPRERAAEARAKSPAEPARTAVVAPEPEAEAVKPPPPPPRKIVLPPRPSPPQPGARVAGPAVGPLRREPMRPTGPAVPGRPLGPSGPARPGPSVYRPGPGGPPRPMGPRPGGPLRPGGPVGRPGAPPIGRAAPPAVSDRPSVRRKKDDKET